MYITIHSEMDDLYEILTCFHVTYFLGHKNCTCKIKGYFFQLTNQDCPFPLWEEREGSLCAHATAKLLAT